MYRISSPTGPDLEIPATAAEDRPYFTAMDAAAIDHHSLLTNNDRRRILVCLSQLTYDAPEALARTFPDYVPQPQADGRSASSAGHFPSSTYLVTA